MHKKITKIEAARDEALNELLAPLGLSSEELRLEVDEPMPHFEDPFPGGVPDFDDLPPPALHASRPKSAVSATAKTTTTRAKRRITIWVDHEVIDDFKRRAGKHGYQTLMARTLREGLRRSRAAHAPR